MLSQDYPHASLTTAERGEGRGLTGRGVLGEDDGLVRHLGGVEAEGLRPELCQEGGGWADGGTG